MRWIVIAVLLFYPISANCQTAKPSIAEIKLDDGSSVRVSILIPSVEVETKYGRLVVPFSDIRRIEFGLHVSAEQQATIDRSVKRLASASHKERATASADLLSHGYIAAPMLRVASSSPDQETATRADAVLKMVGERTDKSLMDLRDYDVVHAQTFSIHGKIISPSIKSESKHFGIVDLQLPGLRSLSMRNAGGQSEIVVDATKHGSSLDQWLDTGIVLDAGNHLAIQAEGQVELWPQGPGQYVAQPRGYNTAGRGGQFMAGALVAKIGEGGKAFFVGERFDSALREEGRLHLQIIPSPWNNASSGSYRVRINVK